jgi:hypothetical protein
VRISGSCAAKRSEVATALALQEAAGVARICSRLAPGILDLELERAVAEQSHGSVSALALPTRHEHRESVAWWQADNEASVEQELARAITRARLAGMVAAPLRA